MERKSRIITLIKQFNLSSLMKMIAMLLLIAIVILMSFLGAGLATEYLISVNEFGVETWVVESLAELSKQGIVPMAERLYIVGHWQQILVNIIITASLGIISMILFESIIVDRGTNAYNPKYDKKTKIFDEAFKRTSSLHIYLDQFIIWRQRRDLITKKIKFLSRHGITQAEDIVKHITLDNIAGLLEAGVLINHKNKEIIIRRITDENQIKAIRYMLSGKISIEAPSSEYYMSITSDELYITPSEMPDLLREKIKINRLVQRTFKIVSSLALGILFSIFTILPLIDGGKQAWYDLFTRLFAIVFGAVSGGLTATFVVNLKLRIIEDKTNTLNELKLVIETKEFVPENNDEIARREYDEHYKTFATNNNEDHKPTEEKKDIFARALIEVAET